MARLIDADRLKRDLRGYNVYVEQMIDRQPTVVPTQTTQIQHVESGGSALHGHWISCDDDNDAPYKCSVCGGVKPTKYEELAFVEVVWCKKPYCAICGAKMDEK